MLASPFGIRLGDKLVHDVDHSSVPNFEARLVVPPRVIDMPKEGILKMRCVWVDLANQSKELFEGATRMRSCAREECPGTTTRTVERG